MEQNTGLKTVADLLEEIEDETLYRALLTADRSTLQTILNLLLSLSETTVMLNISRSVHWAVNLKHKFFNK
jgi:hypothetical protein